MPGLIEIDGLFGEGGGQIVRTSCSLAALTGKPFRIYNVRGRRNKPGLQPQHLMAVRAAGSICGAKLRGDAVGSIDLTFEPRREVEGGEFRFNIGTAGSTTLVAQTLLVPLAHAATPSAITIIGGTYNDHAPSIDYLERVYLPALRRAGLQVEVGCASAGYYPLGGGEIQLRLLPDSPSARMARFAEKGVGGGELHPLILTHRADISAEALIVTSNLPSSVAQRAEKRLRETLPDLKVRILDRPSIGVGAAISIFAEGEESLAGATGLGARGKPMERVADEAVVDFRKWSDSGAACDEHLADQLVLPACLAGGRSEWTTSQVTDHLRTSLRLVAQFLSVDTRLEGNRVVISPQS